jgi:WD40 repeat protein
MSNLRFLIGCLILTLIPSLTGAFNLRQVGELQIDGNDHVYGWSSGNIIIANEKSLKILNYKWQIASEIALKSNETAIVSESGKFYAILDKSASADSGLNLAVVYNSRGVPIWSCYELESGEYFLSPNGDYIVAIQGTVGWPDYKMKLYNRDYPVTEFKILSFSELIFSRSGEYFLINSGNKGVRLFDHYGTMVQQFDSKKKMAFSRDEKWVALFDYKGNLEIFENGQSILEIDLKLSTLSQMAIRRDIGRVAAAFTRSLQLWKTDNKSIDWKYPTGRDGGSYMSVDFSPDGKFVAAGVDINFGTTREPDKRHVTGYLYVYDYEGQTLSEQRFKYGSYSEGMPIVRFLDDNRTVLVRNKESLHFIEMY